MVYHSLYKKKRKNTLFPLIFFSLSQIEINNRLIPFTIDRRVQAPEFVSVQLFKSYCLRFILYAIEAIPLTKSSVRLLDNCAKQAVAKIFVYRVVRDKQYDARMP